MIDTLILINSIILLSISLLHLYWAFGGNWGIEYTIPEKHKDSFFNPKNKAKVMSATIVVALALLASSMIIASNYKNFLPFIDQYWIIIFTRIIGLIFLFRVVGDFKMFGLFKKKLPVNSHRKTIKSLFLCVCT